jgi:ABC-type lipoprotein export system ATPase subunit
MIAERLLESEGERDALVAALDSVLDGRGRLVVLVGEAGLGKTALLAVAGELAAARECAKATCSASGGCCDPRRAHGAKRVQARRFDACNTAILVRILLALW